jgi:hypothetical protein
MRHAILFVIFFQSSAGSASESALKELALTLMRQQFRQVYSESSIKNLSITEVRQVEGGGIDIAYGVTVDDRRDPHHQALNHMAAKARFINHDGEWRLTGVNDMKQDLEFSDPL